HLANWRSRQRRLCRINRKRGQPRRVAARRAETVVWRDEKMSIITIKNIFRLQFSIMLVFTAAVVAAAQGSTSLGGKYGVTTKGRYGDKKHTLKCFDEGKKFSGQITPPHGF